MKRLAVIALVAIIPLTACGGSPSASPATVTVTATTGGSNAAGGASSTGGSGIPNGGLTAWAAANNDGTAFDIDLSKSATGGFADKMRHLAKKSGHAAPAMYWLDVDNRQGAEAVSRFKVTGADADANQFESLNLEDTLTSWEPKGVATDLTNELIAAANEADTEIVKGAKGRALVAFDKPPSSVSTLQVSPYGVSPADASPAQGG